jgi:HAE1 family hydrophobic/amphiphilic exporter-1
MKLAEVSIARPVFTSMVIAAIVVFGVVLYNRLPVDMFPEVDFPVMTVTVIYPGADPQTMESQVADPVEEALASIGGLDAIRSVSLESVCQVILEFEVGLDIDAVAQDVRDRMATIRGQLPDGIEDPLVQKLDPGAKPIVELAVASEAGAREVATFVENQLKPALERLDGVGEVELIGLQRREVHVWIDPPALRARGLTVLELVQALGAQNVDIPGGRIERDGEELVLRTDATAVEVGDFEQLAIATIPGRGVVRLGDVARVEDGVEERRSVALLDGASALALSVRKRSGANTVAVAEAVQEALPALAALGPEGTTVDVLFDNAKFIRSSVESVQLDLALGALLAVTIIFVFLRDPRATFVSALALPTSVIGTFAFMAIMGFTLNTMTLIALSLSVGILIDDAIVVIENIARRRSTLGESPRDAAYRGTAEIALAVLATTLSIVAVFIPVAFMSGMVGQFFYQFGLTVAFAVLLSLFVSFTLTPMLSSRVLRAHEAHSRGWAALVGRLLDGLDGWYRSTLGWILRHRIITLAAATAALGASLAIVPGLGMEMMPATDQSQFTVTVEMPPGTALAETTEEAHHVEELLRELPGVTSTFTRVGGGVRQRVNLAEIIVTMVPREVRAFSQAELQAHIRAALGERPDRIIVVEDIPMFGISGVRMAPVQLDLRGDDLDQLAEGANRVAQALRETTGFVDVDTTFRTGKPELRVELDRRRAADLGVLGAQVAMTVRSMIAGQVATRFDSDGERYDVRVQLPPAARASTAVVERAQLRTPAGRLVDVGAVARVVEDRGPSQIDRENRQRQISVLANLEGGLALSEALAQALSLGDQFLPEGVTATVGGMGASMEESFQDLFFALFLAIICIYMILAAQFESLVHPFTIMMSLPFSLIGALGALLLAGLNLGIFAMIGFIMLMGLVTKNAILLVDFANQLRRDGQEMVEALINAGAVRLRPILMTTAAMIFGMIPVAVGHGDGGEVRAPMGVLVIGGLITSTFLTLLVVPVIYTLMDGVERAGRWLVEKISPATPTTDPDESATAPAEEGLA